MFTKGFPQDKQIAYSSLTWLITAQIIVMLPLMLHLPLWIIPILIFSALWRIRVMRGQINKPSRQIKVIIGLLGLVALTISDLPPVSLDMMASLLLLGFAYKALEATHQRDAMVIIFTGFLLIGVQFLYIQSMLGAVYGIFSLSVLTGAMITIQQPKNSVIFENLKLAGTLLLLCLPLMLSLFIFTPRFSPLWSITLPSSQAKTGVTDSMTPGDIANLSQSDELAFRVTFLGERPTQKELYWRGIVLQHFDGNTWTQFTDDVTPEEAKFRLQSSQYAIRNRLEKKGYGRQYDVIYEDSGQFWLFALSPVVGIEGNASFGKDFRIIANKKVHEPLRIKLTSFPEALRDVNAFSSDFSQALQLPQHGNPKSKALALRLLATSRSKQDFIQKVLRRYQQQHFFYSLHPAILDKKNSIDDFLLNTKKGFCAHYAGSFVYLMRAAGIPARVIVGYQGGEWNEQGGYLAIHQYDAHAWAEVWLEDQGWVRFDPTAMVAPERVEKNLEVAMKNEGSFLEGQLLSSVKYQWLKGVRQRWDSSQYTWRKFVLGYNQTTQTQFLKRIFGHMSTAKAGLIGSAIFFCTLAIWLLFLGLTRKQAREAIEHQLYRQFCQLLEKQGIRRKPFQCPADFSQLAATQLPVLAPAIQHFTQVYIQLCYAPIEQSTARKSIRDLKESLKVIRKYT